MPDHAISDDPGVQRQLDRLGALSPGADVLGLERITALLDRLGNPERRLPPVFHVAGTNGKGSTCAFLRAAIEAQGLRAHVYTSPHLVRFNERIRLAGRLIDDAALTELLAEVLDVADGIAPSFFEVTTAAALLAFARAAADACIVEVGLGGRLDATNVIPAPVACGIAQLGVDHQQFLGSQIEQIAAEKAGIAKRGVPLIIDLYPEGIAGIVGAAAGAVEAPVFARGSDWDAAFERGQLLYEDRIGPLALPLPRHLRGAHQAGNAGLAIAMLRHQQAVKIGEPALQAAMRQARWPARLQQLVGGPLRDLLPDDAELWLDGGHNPAAARAIADFFGGHIPTGRPFHIVFGLLENKDAAGVLEPFGDRAAIHTVPVAGHTHHIPETLAGMARDAGLDAAPSRGVEDALRTISRHAGPAPVVLILGSLYLAGEVLRANDQVPS